MKKTYLKKAIAVISLLLIITGVCYLVFSPHCRLSSSKYGREGLEYNKQKYANLDNSYKMFDWDSFDEKTKEVRIALTFPARYAYFHEDGKYAFVPSDSWLREYGVYINEEYEFPELTAENILYVNICAYDNDISDYVVEKHITNPDLIRRLVDLNFKNLHTSEECDYDVEFIFNDGMLKYLSRNIPDRYIKEIIQA